MDNLILIGKYSSPHSLSTYMDSTCISYLCDYFLYKIFLLFFFIYLEGI
jgi:hypothetical protein